MAERKLAATTVKRFKKLLEEEQDRLRRIIDIHETERNEVRLAETAAERSPDPEGADGGSMAFEFEKELSVDRNTKDLLTQVEQALWAIKEGTYGTCRTCEAPIPVARLEVIPHTTLCVDCASGRR